MGLPWWLAGKNLPANTGGMGSVSGWGRPPRGGHSNPLQYPCLDNPMDRGSWWAKVHGVAKSSLKLHGHFDPNFGTKTTSKSCEINHLK